ncbi:MAG TPA: winged helix-turn-helix domain-containing protein, partial [Pyrinomonadaceae bacterium]|nr:winged helix-turn-helix domain-containing protein [Pyrinomonadaceae bacterium]
KNHGRIVEKQELFEQIWRENFVSDNALTRVIREIRQVIGDDAAAPRYIETVPKHGYRFIAEVEKLEKESNGAEKIEEFAFAGKAEKTSAEIEDGKQENREKSSKYLLFIATAVLLLIVPLAAWLFFRETPSSDFPSTVVHSTQLTNWTGLDNFPAISPDGNSVAYSSDRTGSFEIYVKPLAPGAKEIQITSDGQQNLQPSWSPDRQRIAFHSKTRGGIWIVPASGGTVRQLTEFGSHPSFSPDGKQIAFQTGSLTDLGAHSRILPPTVLWLISSEGSEPRQLTQPGNPSGGHSAPAWSPDGKRIAFNVTDMISRSIWTIEVETGETQEINARSGDPVYAPDGKSIYFIGLNGLWQLPVSPANGKAAGEPKHISDDGPAQARHPSISADGKKIVYEMLMSASRISQLSLDKEANAEPVPLLQNSASRNTFPVFSPDGRRIAYTSGRPGSLSELWVMNSDGQNPTQITSNVTISNWFPDNERIAFVALREGVRKLSSINLNGGKETTLFTFKSDAEYSRLSPDGRKVAFNSKESGTINVWLGNLETGEQKQLTFDPELAGFTVWSPDGKWLALQIKRGDDTHIAVMPSDGGEMTQLTNQPGQSWIHSFSPDGEHIVFAGQRDEIWNIYTISRKTKEQKKLTNFNKLNSYVRYPSWSPLGDKIVFEYAETTGNIWLTQLK